MAPGGKGDNKQAKVKFDPRSANSVSKLLHVCIIWEVYMYLQISDMETYKLVTWKLIN